MIYPQAGLGLEIESRSIVRLLGCIIEIQTSASVVLASELWTLLQVGNKIIIIKKNLTMQVLMQDKNRNGVYEEKGNKLVSCEK